MWGEIMYSMQKETAQVFVEVYGAEEDNNEQFIYADTLIIFSKLSLIEIKEIFNKPKDIFPSDIGAVTVLHNHFVVSDNGRLIQAENPANSNYSVFYCWWD